MPESETYVTKQQPSLDDWLAYNDDFFSRLKGESTTSAPHYAPFVDVDQHAAEANISTEEYFEHVRKRVGSLVVLPCNSSTRRWMMLGISLLRRLK